MIVPNQRPGVDAGLGFYLHPAHYYSGATLRPSVEVIRHWGLYDRNVETLTLHDVRFNLSQPDLRPAVLMDRVVNLQTDNFRYLTHGAGGAQ